MELTISFVCPDCHHSHEKQIQELRLGEQRPCVKCGAPTELTEEGLSEFSKRVEGFLLR